MERMGAIVEATKRLLEKMEASAISTTLVASEAGVPIGSVYRYFPHIEAIYGAIFTEFRDVSDELITTEIAKPETEWRDSFPTVFMELRRILQENPAFEAVFVLAMSNDELAKVRIAWNQHIAELLKQRWRIGCDRFSGGNPDIVARMTIEIFSTAESLIVQHKDEPGKHEELFAEALVMLEAYLSKYLH